MKNLYNSQTIQQLILKIERDITLDLDEKNILLILLKLAQEDDMYLNLATLTVHDKYGDKLLSREEIRKRSEEFGYDDGYDAGYEDGKNDKEEELLGKK